jgi:hypothetical protein
MILINDGYGIGTINPELIYKNIKARSVKLHKIIDDDYSSQERRGRALREFMEYQKELQILDKLVKIPFDTLIIIERERDFEKDKKWEKLGERIAY